MWSEPSADKLASLPKIGETEGVPLRNKIVHLHFFIHACDWWICEYGIKDDLLFGFTRLNADDQNSEWGYTSLSKLREINFKGFEVECDEHWTPRPAGEIPDIKV